MSSWKDRKFFKFPARDSFRLPKFGHSFKELMCAGVQIIGGTALTTYTYDNPTYRILPFMYFAIAIGGAYHVFKIMQENYCSVRIKTNRIQSAWELANGALAYSVGIYAFSEGLKSGDKIWIPCLAVATSGYYFCIKAFHDLVPIFNRRPILQLCHLMFEPGLIACADTYLIYYRHHEENCLYWLPFVFIGIIGFNIATEGFSEADNRDKSSLLLKVIKTMMGGCVLTLSCLVLTIYGSINKFHSLWITFMVGGIFFGAFLIFGSLTCLRRYIDLETQIFLSFSGMIAGPLVFSSACFTIHYVEDASMVRFIFLLLAGLGHFLLCRSIYEFYKMLPVPFLRKCYLCLLGPVVTIYSSFVATCIGRRMGWRFSLVIMPFIPAGMYATYRGFRKEKDRDIIMDRMAKIHKKYQKNVALRRYMSPA
ncbi:uncharacterized protein LOC129976197 isoform X2 [Argiope bruennichi]|uniref:Uncharacterized protein n=1 Tax=Argiope bruennichi TaxID=94029 RepID=A0A8T0ERX6_ARGBR|nr:uncharacterized protein LOC129976197 isoform X2 [Argiope bruennichi]KAF8778692.1 hypothetical protein HNY73_015392 [Argiope bruennichi]